MSTWKKFKTKTESFSKESLATLTVLSTEATTQIADADWFRSLNFFSSEVTKSMTHNFIKEKLTNVIAPINHRIFDGGNEFFSSISKAREIGVQNKWTSSRVFEEWLQANNIYKFLKELGISDKDATDVITVHGQEALESLLIGTICAVALVFAWRAQDKEAFSKSIGFILMSGVITMTPSALIVAVVALAIGYNTLVCKESIARGVLSSGLTFAVGSMVPGPALLGPIPAIALTIYINKKLGKDFRPLEQSAKLFELVCSEEFRRDCIALYVQMRGKVA